MINIKIFTSQRSSQAGVVPDCDIFVPMCGGATLAKTDLPFPGDNTGENISEKTARYCELTTQYWAWKNVDAEYYGFCHYRRYFSFSHRHLTEDLHGAINYEYLDEQAIQELCLERGAIEERVQPYDLILTAPADVRKVHIKNLYEQYEVSPCLSLPDLQLAVTILKEKYPQFSESADRYLNGHLFYPCNMFIMKKALFYQYCEWLYSILEEFERRADMSDYSVEGLRTPGHIGERLLGIFYLYIRDHHPEYKTALLQRCIIWHPNAVELPSPCAAAGNVPIVLACSQYFTPYAAVTIQSILCHTSRQNHYDIIVLHTDIDLRTQRTVQDMVSNTVNATIRFCCISSYLSQFRLIANNHVSVETFYRLLVDQLFPYYDKIIYLDSDLIIRRDLAELYKIDLGENLVGATVDADHAGEYCGAIPGVKDYTDRILQLKRPLQYFQAGVLLINIPAFRKTFDSNELITFAAQREYMYVDQDVLNVKCEGRITYLDMRWNVMTDCQQFRVDGIIKRAPAELYRTYMEARREPFIIHYAGVEKPWSTPDSDMAGFFWEYARATPFYEVILQRMAVERAAKRPSLKPWSKEGPIYRALDRRFPKGSAGRRRLKQIYHLFLK